MEFALIASAHFLALLSPGPDFFLIMQAALRLPLRFGIAICAGIAAANGTYLLCAVLGLQIIKDISWLMLALKYLGAGYLLFLGIMLLRTTRQTLEEQKSEHFLSVPHLGRQFLIGFMSGLFNPKNMIFYLSLFTVMVSDHTSLTARFLYGLWMTSVVFFWDAFIVMFLGRDHVKSWLGSGIFYVEKLSGVVLATFGLTLLLT